MGFHGVPWGCAVTLWVKLLLTSKLLHGYHWNQFVVTLVICHIDPHAIYHGIYHAIYHGIYHGKHHGKHHGTP